MTTIMGITSNKSVDNYKVLVTIIKRDNHDKQGYYNIKIDTCHDFTWHNVMTCVNQDISLPTKNWIQKLIVNGNYHKLSKVLSCLRIAEKAAVLLWLLSRRWIYDWVKERLDPGRGQEEPFIMSFSWVTYFICEFCSIDPLCVAMSPTKM